MVRFPWENKYGQENFHISQNYVGNKGIKQYFKEKSARLYSSQTVKTSVLTVAREAAKP